MAEQIYIAPLVKRFIYPSVPVSVHRPSWGSLTDPQLPPIIDLKSCVTKRNQKDYKIDRFNLLLFYVTSIFAPSIKKELCLLQGHQL